MTYPLFAASAFNATGIEVDPLRKALAVIESLTLRPIDGIHVTEATPVTVAELSAVHDPSYVEAVLTGEPWHLAESNGVGWDEGLFTAVCASTGGARDAALAALASGRVAGSASSGLHHARYERGAGYCTFNGLVVAAHAALGAGARRVLILDLDAHCGGGTASLIEDLPGVEQIDVSVNTFDHYRSRPDARLWITDGPGYTTAVNQALEAIDTPEDVDLLIYNAGMDPHQQAGGVHGLTTDILAAREERVFTWAHQHGLPVAFVFAGGYTGFGFTMDKVVDLHRLTLTAALING